MGWRRWDTWATPSKPESKIVFRGNNKLTLARQRSIMTNQRSRTGFIFYRLLLCLSVVVGGRNTPNKKKKQNKTKTLRKYLTIRPAIRWPRHSAMELLWEKKTNNKKNEVFHWHDTQGLAKINVLVQFNAIINCRKLFIERIQKQKGVGGAYGGFNVGFTVFLPWSVLCLCHPRCTQSFLRPPTHPPELHVTPHPPHL